MTTSYVDPQTKEAASTTPGAKGALAEEGNGAPKAAREAPEARSVVLDRESPEFLAKAHSIYADLRAKGPVVRTSFGASITDRANPGSNLELVSKSMFSRERLFVTRYNEAVSTLVDDRLSSDFRTPMSPEQRAHLEANMPDEIRPIAHSILMLDPPDHTRLRKLVQPSFSPRAMEALRARITTIVEDLLDKAEREAAERGEVAPDRRMDLIESFAYPMPVTVISDMLGIPTKDRDQVHVWAERLLRADRQDGQLDEETRAGMRAFARYLEELFAEKRQAPTDDMISQMILAQEDGDRLNDKELLSMVFILFFAGHVTTVNLIGNGVVALLTHPEQHARFLADPAGLAKGMVEETLRYWGPVDFMSTPRIVKEEMEIGGTHVPKGEKLSVGLASANRDPEQFANPDAFDITRADAHKNIAFGKGIHLCIGAPLARMEGQIAFEALFRRFPKLRLTVPAESMRWGNSAGLRGFSRVPVAF